MRHAVEPQDNGKIALEGDDEMAGFSISRKNLYEEIWSLSATKVAEKYELSYTRLLRACRENQIPVPPPGYYTKLATGKSVGRIPLPGSETETIVIEASRERRAKVSAVNDESLSNQASEFMIDTYAEQTEEEDDQDKIPLVRYGDKERAEREELYQKIWERPVSEVAKEYHISDNALRKRCIRLNVPLPERGYWARLKAGKTVSKSDLPVLKLPKQHKPKTGDRHKLYFQSSVLRFFSKRDKEELLSYASVLRVGSTSSQMLDSVRQMEVKCREWSNLNSQGEYGNYYIPRRTETPFLADVVSPKSYSRVFHLIDALLRALLPYSGSMGYDHTLRVNGETVSFSITEDKDRVVHEITQAERLRVLEYEEARRNSHYASRPQIPKYDHPWSGRLKIVIQEMYVFQDCKAYVLEDRIGEIFVSLFEASFTIRLQRMQAEERQRAELEESRRKEQLKRRYSEEVDRTMALVNAAQDYSTACMIRAYIEAVRASGAGEADPDPDWLEWAAQKADWFDPTVAREDEWFGKRRHQDSPERKKLDRRW